MQAVIDTNIFVSAFLTHGGNANLLTKKIAARKIRPCYDLRMLDKYKEVLTRKKFNFPLNDIKRFLIMLVSHGIRVEPVMLPDSDVKDESDRPFYEVAKYCNAPLLTGNIKHFPDDPLVMSLADFCALYLTE